MQTILDNIEDEVRPSLRKYLAAERVLTDAQLAHDTTGLVAARKEVRLAARQAVDVLHHLTDFVFKEAAAPMTFPTLGDARQAVLGRRRFSRTGAPIDDVSLLRDVSVAFKHHVPDYGTVAMSTDIVPADGGFGNLRYGEGKYGGVEQVIVTRVGGERRALSSILCSMPG